MKVKDGSKGFEERMSWGLGVEGCVCKREERFVTSFRRKEFERD